MADKKQPSNKMSKMLDMLENIISLFQDKKDGLTTAEIYKGMCDEFGYSKTLRNFELTYLPKLVNGIIRDVTFKQVKNGKHTLVDNRIIHSKEKIEKHQKMLTLEQLVGEEKAYMKLALQAIKDLQKLSDKHYNDIEKRFALDTLNTPYFIESEETELMEPNNANTNDLINCIKNDQTIIFHYSGVSSKDEYTVEPYKLITFDGLWYIFGKDTDDDDTPYKTWRLKHIDIIEIDDDSSHGVSHDLIDAVLDQGHAATFIVKDFAKTEVESVKIKLKIAAIIGDSIHLPGEEENILHNDGSRTITCDVSTINEIDRDIKSWLPHIEVLEPEEYRIKFKKEIAEYTEKLN